MQSSLTSQQRQKLKGLAHGSKPPLFQVGKDGLSEPVLKSLGQALSDHQLIKVQFLEKGDIDRYEYAGKIAGELKAEVVQVIGFKAVFYRRNPEKRDLLGPAA